MVIANISSDKMQKRILIVDDHPLNLMGLSRALKVLCDFHGEITAVMSGRETIREAGLFFYNICFLDIDLPDMSGIEVMKKIQEVSPETDIVIMSACQMHDNMKRTIEENASLFISKPFDLTEIKAFMKHAFKGDLDFYRDRESCGEALIKGQRQFKRRPLVKTIDCSVNNFDIMKFKGDIIDISYAGMSMQSDFPLEHGRVLNFNKGIAHKKGIVRWSTKLSDNNHRVGISFI